MITGVKVASQVTGSGPFSSLALFAAQNQVIMNVEISVVQESEGVKELNIFWRMLDVQVFGLSYSLTLKTCTSVTILSPGLGQQTVLNNLKIVVVAADVSEMVSLTKNAFQTNLLRIEFSTLAFSFTTSSPVHLLNGIANILGVKNMMIDVVNANSLLVLSKALVVNVKDIKVEMDSANSKTV